MFAQHFSQWPDIMWYLGNGWVFETGLFQPQKAFVCEGNKTTQLTIEKIKPLIVYKFLVRPP